MAAALSREAFLLHVGKLAEETVEVPGMGNVLCRELTGSLRATVLGILAPSVQEGGKADIGLYQEYLLRFGLIDPADNQPLLDVETAKKAMELGASKVEVLCKTIERLSGMDGNAVESAEKNSGSIPSSDSTSG